MDFQHTTKAPSWIWQGIKRRQESLEKGMCYRIRQGSKVRIGEDPWIPKLPLFKLSVEIIIPDSLRYVTDLTREDKRSWNKDMVEAVFPLNFSKMILSIPITNEEHESFVWCPSTTWMFSVRYSYRTNNRERFCTTSRLDRRT